MTEEDVVEQLDAIRVEIRVDPPTNTNVTMTQLVEAIERMLTEVTGPSRGLVIESLVSSRTFSVYIPIPTQGQAPVHLTTEELERTQTQIIEDNLREAARTRVWDSLPIDNSPLPAGGVPVREEEVQTTGPSPEAAAPQGEEIATLTPEALERARITVSGPPGGWISAQPREEAIAIEAPQIEVTGWEQVKPEEG